VGASLDDGFRINMDSDLEPWRFARRICDLPQLRNASRVVRPQGRPGKHDLLRGIPTAIFTFR